MAGQGEACIPAATSWKSVSTARLSAETAGSSALGFTSVSKERHTLVFFFRKLAVSVHTGLLYSVVFYPTSGKQEPNPRVLFTRDSCVTPQDP